MLPDPYHVDSPTSVIAEIETVAAAAPCPDCATEPRIMWWPPGQRVGAWVLVLDHAETCPG